MTDTDNPTTPSRRWLLLGLGVLLIHAAALYLPGSPNPAQPAGWDKAVHVALFGVPSALTVMHGSWVRRWGPPALVVHAVVSEVIQAAWIPHRSGDSLDALADIVGVALGWYIGGWLSGPTVGAAVVTGSARDSGEVPRG